MVPAGSEPVGAPYRLVVCCDLRKRKEELAKKGVYVVAYDMERLRKYGAGIGIDALEASNSVLARDECVCSDIVPIKFWYGEVQLVLHPPDSADGDVLVLLRVVKTSNLNDMQDWNPIGDAVIVKVEPRITREDKKCMRQLRAELELSRNLVKTTANALDGSHSEHKASLSDRAELRAALAKSEFEMQESQDDVRELHAELDKVTSELEAERDTGAHLKTALKIRGALNQSKMRQIEASKQISIQVQGELDQSQRDLEVQHKAINDTRIALARAHEKVKNTEDAESKTMTALAVRTALDRAHVSQLRTSTDDERQKAEELEKTREEARASENIATELRDALARSEQEAEGIRSEAGAQQAAIERAQSETAEHRAALSKAHLELAEASMDGSLAAKLAAINAAGGSASTDDSRAAAPSGTRSLAEASIDGSLAAKLSTGAAPAEEEVVDIKDDEETNKAATKMQSIQRGKKARKEVDAKRNAKGAAAPAVASAPPPAAQEETVDIPDDEETNKAATKMQSIQRGKNARKEVDAKRNAKGAAAPAATSASPPPAQEENVDIPDDEETNKAATKMQSIQRGKNARKQVDSKKQQQAISRENSKNKATEATRQKAKMDIINAAKGGQLSRPGSKAPAEEPPMKKTGSVEATRQKAKLDIINAAKGGQLSRPGSKAPAETAAKDIEAAAFIVVRHSYRTASKET